MKVEHFDGVCTLKPDSATIEAELKLLRQQDGARKNLTKEADGKVRLEFLLRSNRAHTHQTEKQVERWN